MHVLDLFFPQNSKSTKASHVHPRGLLVFVHGGAWGSGLPWMYRLVAKPFLEDLSMAVAIVGYRSYPDAHAEGQVKDVEQALSHLKTLYNFHPL
jgi:acetyl esterase/lipase